ncbi:MAG: cytochrome b [Rhodobacterales bacterium]
MSDLTAEAMQLRQFLGGIGEVMERQEQHYKAPARWLHWSVALLVLTMLPVGLLMVQEGLERAVQDRLFIFHKNVGVIVGLLVILRLAYRALNPPPRLPSAIPQWQKTVSAWTHGILYGLIFLLPVSGYIRVRAGGFPIEMLDGLGFGTFLPRSDTLAETAKTIHYFGGLALMALIALHVGAALYHGLIKRDGVLQRMWPSRR